jgi:predicted nucleotidyltransferase
MQLFEIRSKLAEQRSRLAERYAVDFLGIFGSYVRGSQRPDSDLDLLVSFAKPIDLFRFVALENELSELLGVSVDLVMKDALKPRIGKRILTEVIPV